MTATAVAPSTTSTSDADADADPAAATGSSAGSWAHGPRLVLAALAVVVLLVAAFVIGRATASSAHVVTTVIRTPLVTPTTFCRLGRPC